MSEIIKTEARTMIGEIPVYCSYDEIVDIGKMVPNPKNPNQHPKEQLRLLSQIIKSQGWRQPITVSNRSGYIVKGHGRLQAAILLESDKVPVDFQNYASEAEEMADLMADNRLAELADMNNTMLAELLVEYDTGELPIELTGYTEEDLEGILSAIAGEDDAEPNDQDNELEQPCSPMTKPGDLWLLGPHRLICGSAADEKTIEKLMDGEKAAMVHTDPPHDNNDDLINRLLIPALNNHKKYTTDDAAFYIWHTDNNRRALETAMEEAGLTERQYLIWYKDSPGKDNSDYQMSHEPCFYASKEGATPNWYGDRSQESVLVVTARQNGMMETVIGSGLVITDGKGAKFHITSKPPKDKKVRYIRMEDDTPLYLYDEDNTSTIWQADRDTKPIHPEQKPVELSVRAIENSSQPGEIVLDLFGGSGSTLIGAEETGRVCYTSEISPAYSDVIVSRYVLATGNLGITCIRDGQEYPYIEMVKQWAVENDKEEEINAMRTPVVVVEKIVQTKETMTYGES